MKKRYIVALSLMVGAATLLSPSTEAFGQGASMDNRIPGRAFVPENVNNVEGTPYLYPDFSNGSFLMTDNKTVINGLQIRYDVFRNILTYKGDNGVEMVSNEPIRRFTIENKGKVSIFQSGFPAIDKWDTNTYYEVLNVGGDVFLLKKLQKTLLSGRAYNSSKVTDSYLDATKYYIFTAKKEMLKFKADKKSLASYFGDKQNLISDYLDKNKINLKDEADLAKVFNYYNSLK